jgi:hypothetical protein
MGLRSKVFEFSASQAPTITIDHVWSIFSKLAASTSRPVWQMVPSGTHGVGAIFCRPAAVAPLGPPSPMTSSARLGRRPLQEPMPQPIIPPLGFRSVAD